MKPLIPITPQEICPPFARYSHAMVVPAGYRLLFCSGQLGIAPDRQVPAAAGDQAVLCFENILAILRQAGMDKTDIIRINAYLTDRDHLPDYMAVRDRYVGAPPPASTLMLVQGFARPEFKVEVEVIAAGAEGGVE